MTDPTHLPARFAAKQGEGSMTELNAETLAEWRKDATTKPASSALHREKSRRIRVLIAALKAERSAREEAEAREGNERVQAGWEKARADKAEQERDDALTLLREIQETETDND